MLLLFNKYKIINKMVIFKCQRCEYETTLKANLKTHLNKKKPCVSLGNTTLQPTQLLQELYPSDSREKKYICKCGNTYYYCSGLSAHKKKCITYKKDEIYQEHKYMITTINKLEKEIEKLKRWWKNV